MAGINRASIIIRTFNEERYLGELLDKIGEQATEGLEWEVIIVDSGSTDRTLKIAEKYGCRIVHIAKADFSFGRSLNYGCESAMGDVLVFISGHCVPASRDWLQELLTPLTAGVASLSYGRQVGGPETKFSETQLFRKYFPEENCIPQSGFFCNNANATVLRSVWERFRFDEDLTGLEDMHLAKRACEAGHRVAYVAGAAAYHHHHETWAMVKRRYEREAIALKHIMPEVHLTVLDVVRYFVTGVLGDLAEARRQRRSTAVLGEIVEIVLFRFAQFWGAYRGNHETRKLSQARKEKYFYPAIVDRNRIQEQHQDGEQVRSSATIRGAATYEG